MGAGGNRSKRIEKRRKRVGRKDRDALKMETLDGQTDAVYHPGPSVSPDHGIKERSRERRGGESV